MKNIVVIDAKVILRYLLQDHPAHVERACQVFEEIKQGQLGGYIPEGVLVECVYVLLKVYKVPKQEIVTTLTNLLYYKGIIDENRELLIDRLTLFGPINVDIVDAMVMTTARARGWSVFSFDHDLRKLQPKDDPVR
jgi:predicted nucleic-acid-binding protein